MGAELNTAHGNLPDETTPCNHVRVIENQDGERICKWCGVFEADFDFDPADHPDAGGPAGIAMKATPSGHSVTCQWHCEQVPNECTCGFIQQPKQEI